MQPCRNDLVYKRDKYFQTAKPETSHISKKISIGVSKGNHMDELILFHITY